MPEPTHPEELNLIRTIQTHALEHQCMAVEQEHTP